MGAPTRSSSTFAPIRLVEPDFADRLAAVSTLVDCRLAKTTKERQAIFELRYQAYLRERMISANSFKKFFDRADGEQNARLIGLYVGCKLASSLRIHVCSGQYPNSPSFEVFFDVLEPLLDAGTVIVDTTRIVANEHLCRRHPGLPYLNLRPCLLVAEHFHADILLLTMRAEHQPFYRGAFGFQALCGPRQAPRLIKPVCLMMLNLPGTKEHLYRAYPFFRSTEFDRKKLSTLAPPDAG
jgi:hypothetical protein